MIRHLELKFDNGSEMCTDDDAEDDHNYHTIIRSPKCFCGRIKQIMSDKKRQLKLTNLLGPGPNKVQKIHEHDEQQPDNANNSKSSLSLLTYLLSLY
jgi:hypothetical protein